MAAPDQIDACGRETWGPYGLRPAASFPMSGATLAPIRFGQMADCRCGLSAALRHAEPNAERNAQSGRSIWQTRIDAYTRQGTDSLSCRDSTNIDRRQGAGCRLLWGNRALRNFRNARSDRHRTNSGYAPLSLNAALEIRGSNPSVNWRWA